MARLHSFSGRRIRLIALVAIVLILVIIYVAAAPHMTHSSPFYQRTQEAITKARYDNDVANAMANAGDPKAKDFPGRAQDKSPSSQDRINDAKAQRESDNDGLVDTLKERLRQAELAAKKSADEKWKGAKDAAEKASKEAKRKAEEGQHAPQDQAAQPILAANAKRGIDDVIDPSSGHVEDGISHLRPAEVVASQIVQNVKEAAKQEAIEELHSGDREPVSTRPQQYATSSNASPSPSNAESAELLREMEAARNRQKARLKAEYKKQLKAQEMKRQQEAGAIAVDAKWREPGKLGSSPTDKAPDSLKSTGTSKPKAKHKSLMPAPEPTTPAELEFQKLLALSPTVIFSKSYCPYSTKAKRILTQAFTITPAPYIVELDQHVYGSDIQRFLKERTGRGTVPNVIVAGKSIGGADEIEDFWEKNQLKALIKEIAGKRIVGVVENTDVWKTGWKD